MGGLEKNKCAKDKLTVVARMLGYSQATKALRYAHIGDRETEAAATRIGEVISEMLGIADSGQYTVTQTALVQPRPTAQ